MDTATNSDRSQYEDLARRALAGKEKINRTGINTVGVFGHQMRFNMSAGEFPLVTTKKVFTRGIFEELKWFIKGETNIAPLLAKDVHIWDAWATPEGDLGPVYGEIWRRFPVGIPTSTISELLNSTDDQSQLREKLLSLVNDPKYQPIDQLQELLVNLEKSPYSRRHLVTAWAPSVLPNEKISPQENALAGKQALAPCHTFWQVYVEDMTHQESYNYRRNHYEHLMNCLQFDIDAVELLINQTPEDPVTEEMSLKHDKLVTRRTELLSKYNEADREYDTLISSYTRNDFSILPTKRLSLQLYQR
jgi:thymidylate synthase